MRYLLPAILLLGTQIASAQSILKDKDDKELSVLLNEVVITGTGTEHYLKDAPVQTEVITSKALEQYQARSIDDLLSGLSPSLTFHDGDMGSHIQLNGLNNDYILIMINGKRMNGDVGGQNDLNQLNPANIERIEIVKGAASSLYGSDAIAGVINIITKRNREKMELTNTSRIGEYGDILARLILKKRLFFRIRQVGDRIGDFLTDEDRTPILPQPFQGGSHGLIYHTNRL